MAPRDPGLKLARVRTLDSLCQGKLARDVLYQERELLKRIKVMVVDDSLQFANAVVQFLACSDIFEVLASAHSGHEALARAGSEQPDLMLIDVSMPGMSGLAVAALIKARKSPPKVVMMTLEASEKHRVGAIVAGADAFLPKEDFARDLHTAIETLFGACAIRP